MSLQEIQKFSLSILKDVHIFCQKNSIKYSLAYGTLIGAIRHKGFIPWDDDVDIIMPRSDYDFFCKTYKSERFRLISPLDSDCWIGFARVCDFNETYAESICNWCEQNTGIWIDIFPADGVSDNQKEYQKALTRGRKLWLNQIYCRYAKHSFSLKHSFIYNFKLLAIKLATLNGIFLQKFNKLLIANAQQCPFGETQHWSQLSCVDQVKNNYQDIDDFKDVVEISFENEVFFAMTGYDNFLRNIYGDYMSLPPLEKRVTVQSDVIFYWKNQ